MGRLPVDTRSRLQDTEVLSSAEQHSSTRGASPLRRIPSIRYKSCKWSVVGDTTAAPPTRNGSRMGGGGSEYRRVRAPARAFFLHGHIWCGHSVCTSVEMRSSQYPASLILARRQCWRSPERPVQSWLTTEGPFTGRCSARVLPVCCLRLGARRRGQISQLPSFNLYLSLIQRQRVACGYLLACSTACRSLSFTRKG